MHHGRSLSKILFYGFNLIIFVISSVNPLPRIFRSNEICGPYNKHRIYLDIGDHGELTGTNLTIPHVSFFLFFMTCRQLDVNATYDIIELRILFFKTLYYMNFNWINRKEKT